MALGELGGFFFVEDGSVAGKNGDIAAVVEIVEAEGTFAASDDRKIASGDAKIVLARRIDIKGCGALAENQARGAGAVIERKVVKFENGVCVEKGHRAIFEFDFGATVVGGQNVALADGQIGLRFFPNGFLIGERVAFGFARKAHIALNEAEADDACVARIGGRWAGAERKSDEKSARSEVTERGAIRHVSPPSGTLTELLSSKTEGSEDRLRPSDPEAMFSPEGDGVKS